MLSRIPRPWSVTSLVSSLWTKCLRPGRPAPKLGHRLRVEWLESRDVMSANVAPLLAELTQVNGGVESLPVTVHGHAFDADPGDEAAGFTYHWTITRDGAAYTTGSGSLFTFTPDDDGEYVATATATDRHGATSEPRHEAFTVANVAPTLPEFTSVNRPTEGTPIAFPLFAHDNAADDRAAGFTFAWSVTKNGAIYASGTGPTISFTPDDNGEYVVTATATDKDGATSEPRTESIAVANVAPRLSGLSTVHMPAAGKPVRVTTSALDPSSIDRAAGFTYSWTVTKNGVAYASGGGTTFTF